jgi:uncharacterized membrane protein
VDEKLLELIFLSSIFLLLLAAGYIMPDVVRKEICFGVRIPYDQIDNLLIKNEKTRYKRRYLASCVVFALAVILIMWKVNLEWSFIAGLIILGIISYINYYISYKKMKKIKEDLGEADEKEYVVVDTNFRNNGKKVVVSPLWFLIPTGLSIIDFVIGGIIYNKLPEKIAIHWNASGAADGFAEKSFKAVFGIPANILVLTIILYIMYRLIKRAKQQINMKDSLNSIERSRRFRLAGSAYLAGMSAAISIIDTMNYVKALSIFDIPKGIYQAISILFIIIMLASALIMALFVGQGGSRLKVSHKDQRDIKGKDRNDDSFWKLGMFYFNPSDPSIMVEKRFGIGWTLNFGNMKAVIVFTLILAAIIAISILMQP